MRSAIVLSALVLLVTASAEAQCQFDVTGSTMRLVADCTTQSSIHVPQGMTLDGADHTITVVDPVPGSFTGGVVVNEGANASVINTRITALGLKVACHSLAPVDQRLRGIFLRNASGVIRGNTIVNFNQGASGCQEGNAIEVRTIPTTPAGPAVSVEISHNVVDEYQKTGIAVLGNVDATISHNRVGASATQANLAANGLQVSDGALALIEHNEIAGNSWRTSSAVGTAMLLIGAAPGTVLRQNNIGGNADVGIYVLADDVTVDNNRVFETGPDGPYDIGIGSWGEGNVVTNNKVLGYDTPYDGVADGRNKTADGGLQVE